MSSFQRNFVFSILIINVFGVILAFFNIFNFGYLGPPFFWDSNDTFMDWFNTYYWSFSEERYTEWRSIYLPISFVFFRIFGNINCVDTGADHLRDCDLGSVLYLVMFALLAVLETNRFLKKTIESISTVDRIILCGVLATSFPFAMAIERGNLVIIAYLFLLLYLNNLGKIRSQVYLSLAVMFKPYLLICYLQMFIKPSFLVILTNFFIMVCVFTFFYIWLGDSNVYLIFDNIRNFSAADGYSYFEKLPYTTSTKMWLMLFDDPVRSNLIDKYFGDAKKIIAVFFDCTIIFATAVTLCTILISFKYRKYLDTKFVLYLLLLNLLMISDGSGPYGIMFIVPLGFFVSMELRRPIILYMIATLTLLLDPFFIFSENVIRHSYFLDYEVQVVRGLTVGSILRPIFVSSLSVVSLYYVFLYAKVVSRSGKL